MDNLDVYDYKPHLSSLREEIFKGIEMHLVSLKEQTVIIDKMPFQFRQDETIHTENSYKYSIEEFQDMATYAGFEAQQVWTDANHLFSLHYLTISD